MSTDTTRAPRRSKDRVLLVSPHNVATFVYRDLGILQSCFEAELFQYGGLQSLSELGKRIAQSQAVVIWFAGEHATPAVWFARQSRVPVAVIIGGYDGAWIPDIGYGVKPGSYNACRVRWILRKSNCIFAVSESIKSGIVQLASDAAAKTVVVYNAVDADYFVPDDSVPRAGVLCVGNIGDATIERKGWRLFAEAAAAMPDVPFVAVGPALDAAAQRFVEDAPSNLTWMGELTESSLLKQFQIASVYVQASRHEGFGVAIAEAMACGCIPVVTRVGAMPEVVGETGVYANDFEKESVVRAIRTALQATIEQRRMVRQRVMDLFEVSQRRGHLCREVRSMIENA